MELAQATLECELVLDLELDAPTLLRFVRAVLEDVDADTMVETTDCWGEELGGGFAVSVMVSSATGMIVTVMSSVMTTVESPLIGIVREVFPTKRMPPRVDPSFAAQVPGWLTLLTKVLVAVTVSGKIACAETSRARCSWLPSRASNSEANAGRDLILRSHSMM